MKTKITALALIALTILSCNTGKKSSSETSEANSETSNISNATSIENTKWIITTLESNDLSYSKKSEQLIYFTLNPEGNRVNGYSGCNTFMGTYKLEEGNRISFSQMGSTRMACPDAEINESQILNIFEMADNFTISGDKLLLNKVKSEPLAAFKKDKMTNEPITETYWKLKTLEGKAIKMTDNQEREIYFMLKTNENRVTGFAGCNTINGSYTLLNGNRIRFSKMATTLMACPDVDFNEAEFLKVFELADNFTINDDVLSLNVGRRAPLAVFEAVYFD